MTARVESPSGRVRSLIVDAGKLYELATEISEIRDILTGTDTASLPHDYSTVQMARDRMADLAAARTPQVAPQGQQEGGVLTDDERKTIGEIVEYSYDDLARGMSG